MRLRRAAAVWPCVRAAHQPTVIQLFTELDGAEERNVDQILFIFLHRITELGFVQQQALLPVRIRFQRLNQFRDCRVSLAIVESVSAPFALVSDIT